MARLQVLEFVRSFDGVWSLPIAEVERLRRDFGEVSFTAAPDWAEANRLIPDADVVLGWAVTADNFALARKLRWVQTTAAGVGPLLFPALVESEVVVTNGRGIHGAAMAEHTLAVMLAFARKLHLARDAQHERRWVQNEMWSDVNPLGVLAGTTLGLVGVGSVGKEIATKARALGLRVVAVRRRPGHDQAPVDAEWGPDGFDRLLAESDWVVLAVPLTPATRGLIDARAIALMRPAAVLINLGRGALVDERALAAALARGAIKGAALDVFEREPLAAESPLWSMPNVIVTPHISGIGPRYWERAVDLFAANLRRFLDGVPLLNVVDKRAGY